MQKSIGRWIEKQTSGYAYNGLLLGNKKWTIDTYYNMDESQNNYCEWKKPVKNNNTIWFHLYKILQDGNKLIVTKQISGYWRMRAERDKRKFLEIMGMFIIIKLVIVSWVSIYIITFRIFSIYFNYVQFVLHQPYLMVLF